MVNYVGFFIGSLTGLIGLIIICCLGKQPLDSVPMVAEEIEKLNRLRESGIISQQEFEKRKQDLLGK